MTVVKRPMYRIVKLDVKDRVVHIGDNKSNPGDIKVGQTGMLIDFVCIMGVVWLASLTTIY